MLTVFAKNYSSSVQATLFEMGRAVLKTAREISKIHIAMPNKHCPPINLAPFGLENKNELFVPTGEPHGQIEGTVTRRLSAHELQGFFPGIRKFDPGKPVEEIFAVADHDDAGAAGERDTAFNVPSSTSGG
jgi:Uricase